MGVVLSSPNTQRYRNFFKNVRAGDQVLHYLTNALTRDEEGRSCVVAFSKVSAPPRYEGKRIVSSCSDTIELRKPVPLNKIREMELKSEGLDTLVKMSMQRYLTEITKADFKSILNVYPENENLYEFKF